METAIGQSDLLQALGLAVFNSLWQMAILWVAYQCIITVFRIKRSTHRSFLSVLFIFSGFAWFSYTLVAGFVDMQQTGTAYAGFLNIDGNAELNNWLGTMLPIASIAYLILLILPILNLVRNYRYVQVIRRYGLSRADAQWRMFVQKIAAQMGIKKTVHIWMSDLVSSPVTIGYIKPIILLPLAAVNHLTPQQTEAVLLHELSHIKRYDYFINLLVKCIQAILYFNPFIKAFTKIIEREREKSCDETVMQFQYEPHGYASALLVLEKAAHIPQHSLAVAASDGRKSEFRQRIEWILGVQKKPAFSFNKLAGVLAALLCFIGLNAFLIMSHSPNNGLASLNDDSSFSMLSSPSGFFSGDEASAKTPAEHTTPSVINGVPFTAKADKQESPEVIEPSHSRAQESDKSAGNDIASAYRYVYNLEDAIPQLSFEQEKQVQQALQESKKVIQETQWKAVETTIADALTLSEKQKNKRTI